MLQISEISVILLVGPILLCSVSGLIPFLVAAGRDRPTLGWVGCALVAGSAIALGWPGALAMSFLSSSAILAITSLSWVPDPDCGVQGLALDRDAFDALDAALAFTGA